MALINCLECNKEISDKAISCPNCGAPIKTEGNQDLNISTDNSKSISKGTLALMGFCLGFILLYAGCSVKVDDYLKPANLIVGVIVSTFFSIAFVLIFGKTK
jgi:hypothetical protein